MFSGIVAAARKWKPIELLSDVRQTHQLFPFFTFSICLHDKLAYFVKQMVASALSGASDFFLVDILDDKSAFSCCRDSCVIPYSDINRTFSGGVVRNTSEKNMNLASRHTSRDLLNDLLDAFPFRFDGLVGGCLIDGPSFFQNGDNFFQRR